MSNMHGSLALELYRPTLNRYAPIVGVLVLVAIPWAVAMNSNDGIVNTHEPMPAVVAPVDSMTIKAGELDVPVYYFPDAATGTDNYVSARDSDCSGASSTAPPDFPTGWLKP